MCKTEEHASPSKIAVYFPLIKTTTLQNKHASLIAFFSCNLIYLKIDAGLYNFRLNQWKYNRNTLNSLKTVLLLHFGQPLNAENAAEICSVQPSLQYERFELSVAESQANTLSVI